MMAFGRFSTAIGSHVLVALVLAVLAIGASAVDSANPDSRLEVKHVGAGGQVSVETPLAPRSAAPSGNPPRKLVPFPEDEPRTLPAAPSTLPGGAEADPASGPSLKSRPAVRKVQHVEPVENSAETQEGPLLQPATAPADPHESPGRGLIDEAFAKSKIAHTEADYNAVIDLCQQGMKAGLKKGYQEYSRRLLSWGFNRRGEMRVLAGRDEDALADFEAAVQSNPASWRAIHNRGVSYAALGRVREAMADFNRTIELNKKYGNAWFNRGELKYSQSDFNGAVKDYTAALQLNPADPAILNNRGHALYRLQRFGEALRDYGDALKIDAGFAPALVNRGDTYCALGQYGDAANDYRAAVEANPKLGKAYQGAAWLMATCPDAHYRNDKLAVTVARKAIELDGENDYRYLETLAAAQANAGSFEEAGDTQKRAVAKAPAKGRSVAEQRLALYERQTAFRERPRMAFDKPEEDKEVRKASATSVLKRLNRETSAPR